MKKIYLLITGPIRPNIDYINFLIKRFKNLITHKITILLSYWKDEKIDKNLIKNADFIVIENEPEDKKIFEKITSRTIQQIQLHPKIEQWTPNIYKMFYGIRKMVEYIENNSLIDDNDIVLRIRTDLYIDDCDIKNFNDLLNNIEKNTFYNRFRNHTCDWFSISSYNIFKKIWYIKNDDEHNNIIKNLFNAEAIIPYKCKLNKINIINIRNIINLCICREYTNENNKSLHRYG